MTKFESSVKVIPYSQERVYTNAVHVTVLFRSSLPVLMV